MKELKFAQLYENSKDLYDEAKEVWLSFIHEVNTNDGKKETDDEIINGLQKCIHIQGSRKDMHFELALLNDEAIGISMFAVDLGTIYGLLDHPGYGTVMGFYIKPKYRRQGFGRMFFEHIQAVLKKDGADKMYVCPDLITGIPFWRAMGFTDSGKFDPDDKKPIYIKELSCPYSVISANSGEAEFVMTFYQQNIEILHGKPKTLDEWRAVLSPKDEDEQNFLICRGSAPLAWLRMNGLLNNDMAWISMLVVRDRQHRQGIGSYAVKFAEEFAKQKGFHKLGIHTTEDNLPAQSLYRKHGYIVTEYGACTTGDGVSRLGYTFVKEL